MPETEVLLVAVAIVLVAGCVSGLAGFGFGLVSAQPLLLIFPPATVVATLKILTLATSWITLADAWRDLQPRVVLRLLPWALVGLTGGVAMLAVLAAATIKLLASVVVIGFALLLLRGVRPGGGDQPWALPLAGLTSGALSTSTGLSGPPIVLLFTLRGYGVQAFRATVVAYFIAIDLVSLPALFAQGIIDRWDLLTAAVMMPAALGGRFAGIRLSRRVSRAAFYRITLILLLATGLVGLATAGMDVIG